MKEIVNIRQLEYEIESRLVEALNLTKEEIYNIVHKKALEYYSEPVFDDPDSTTPNVYKRTNRLANSLRRSVESDGNGYLLKVGWENDYLGFRYPSFSSTGMFPSGFQVLQWFNSSSHGGIVPGSHNFWDEAINEMGGETGIIGIFKKNLRAVGLNVA